MAIALEKNCSKIKKNERYIRDLEKILLRKIDESGIDYIQNGSPNKLPGNLSLSFSNIEGETILHRMDLKGICISTGSACDSIKTQVSHVIKAIGIPKIYQQGTIRISLAKNNTKEEVEYIAESLIDILKNRHI